MLLSKSLLFLKRHSSTALNQHKAFESHPSLMSSLWHEIIKIQIPS